MMRWMWRSLLAVGLVSATSAQNTIPELALTTRQRRVTAGFPVIEDQQTLARWVNHPAFEHDILQLEVLSSLTREERLNLINQVRQKVAAGGASLRVINPEIVLVGMSYGTGQMRPGLVRLRQAEEAWIIPVRFKMRIWLDETETEVANAILVFKRCANASALAFGLCLVEERETTQQTVVVEERVVREPGIVQLIPVPGPVEFGPSQFLPGPREEIIQSERVEVPVPTVYQPLYQTTAPMFVLAPPCPRGGGVAQAGPARVSPWQTSVVGVSIGWTAGIRVLVNNNITNNVQPVIRPVILRPNEPGFKPGSPPPADFPPGAEPPVMPPGIPPNPGSPPAAP